jgi:TatD DNase family protein
MSPSPERPPLPEPLPATVIDDHTHLEPRDLVAFEPGDALPGLESAIADLDDATAVGVVGVVQVGTDLATSRWSVALAEADARVLAAIAIHPNDAPALAEAGTLDDALAELDVLAARDRVRAIGETGLDFFRTGEDGLAAQIASFEAHIDIAKRHGLALQIHDRDAHDAVEALLQRVGAPECTVLHCFSGDADFARRAVDAGWYLSFAGTVTFGNAPALREALSVTPRERILLETDAPYLTPHPFRGRRNAPAMAAVTLRSMAAVLDADVAELASRIMANTEAVYGQW